jgi:single-stranded-DNA-specific exonuclease
VVGIVASRLKDQLHRPAFVFAQGQDGLLKGSGRSIAGFHLRDALDLIHKQHPDLLKRFGGHAMAAGCTIDLKDLSRFQQAFEDIAEQLLDADVLLKRLHTDGSLTASDFSLDTAHMLDQSVWGPGFEPPLFQDDVEVIQQRLVGERHLKLSIKLHGQTHDGIWFGRSEPLPAQATLAYRLSINEFQGRQRVQMVVEGMGDDSAQLP